MLFSAVHLKNINKTDSVCNTVTQYVRGRKRRNKEREKRLHVFTFIV